MNKQIEPLNNRLHRDLHHMGAECQWYQHHNEYFIQITRSWHVARLLHIVRIYYPNALVVRSESAQPSDQITVCIGTVFDFIQHMEYLPPDLQILRKHLGGGELDWSVVGNRAREEGENNCESPHH